MKKFIAPSYTFTPGASGVGTVDLSGIASFNIKYLVCIINQTDGIVIYSTASTTKGYTAVLGTVVTLQFDTTGMSSGDTLQVIYEDNGLEDDINSIDGKLPATLGQTTMANSLAVVIASNQSTLPVTQGASTNGSNTDSTVSTVITLSPPANSVGFILMNLDTSTANLRWRIGAVATSSSGQQLQPGRDTGFIPCAAAISLCSESGTNNYNVQWILSS
jgi:hypothetical protein